MHSINYIFVTRENRHRLKYFNEVSKIYIYILSSGKEELTTKVEINIGSSGCDAKDSGFLHLCVYVYMCMWGNLSVLGMFARWGECLQQNTFFLITCHV